MSDKPRSPQPAAKPVDKGAAVGLQENPIDDNARESLTFLAPAQSADELGRLAHYRILKILGQGGMGTVFLAEDTRLHRLIALKVMLPSIAKKQIAQERFTREAHATAKIEHDHIVTIYEVNTDRGVPYLAMQFLKGMTLEDWLKAGKSLNMPQVMRIGKEIAKGLSAAHACGLVHRDIKPSNIWLDAANKGRVKILDFGLARPTNEDTSLTQEGIILGSPAYMSPEQARGQDVDARSDLFSLGCVLYRLCTGRLPFHGKDTMSMLLAIATEQPVPLEKLNSSVPASLVQLIHQLLAKKPEARPASARDVVQTLQNIERDWTANNNTLASSKLTESPVAAADKTQQTPKAEDVDVSLEESVITELELQPLPQRPNSSSSSPIRSHMPWMLAGLAGILIAIVSVTCCLVVVVVSNQGRLRIVAGDAVAQAHLRDVGVTVLHHDNKEYVLKDEEQRLPAGGYHVKAGSLPNGMQLLPDPFTLHRGESLELKFQLILADPVDPVVKKKEPPPLELVTTDNAQRLQVDWSRYLGTKVTETNSIGMKLVLIPPGEFAMGSTPEAIKQRFDEMKRIDEPNKKFPEPKKFEKKPYSLDAYKKQMSLEIPKHTVRLTKPFYIGQFEVTVEQFSKFLKDAGYVPKGAGTGLDPRVENIVRAPEFRWDNNGFLDSKKPDCPVSNVTWEDAKAFCQWLSNKENKVYRLPTEAEWEYACRAGSTTAWSFGDDWKAARDIHHFVLKDFWLRKGMYPVGSKRRPNDFGLHDMHGNVAEMCADLFSPDYYAQSPTVDPKGPPDNMGHKVVRGGSFKDLAPACRSASREPVDPRFGWVHVGFRVVFETQPPAD